MKRLAGKTIVVTGAAGLLGRQHVRAILNEGGKVALLDLDIDSLLRYVSELPKVLVKNTLAIQCNVVMENEVQVASDMIQSSLGLVSGLVNNAAINPSVEKNNNRFIRLENIKYESWQEELDVGLWGSIVCSRVFAAKMIKNRTKGSIVNISSDHGIVAPNQSLYKLSGVQKKFQPVKPVTYSVVKHGLIGLTRYLATYWAEDEIRVNALCPGGVLNGQDSGFQEKVSKLIPLGRLAKPEELRGALIFLLSDESSYMTGSLLTIDGGRTVW